MDFESAHKIGSEAEAEVSSELRRLGHKYGFRVIDDILLDLGSETAQLDHVVVDTYGVVIVETKARHGALIRGLDAEKKWTACYPGRRREVFQNPLLQNRQHEAVLRKALPKATFLTPDHVKSCVVFIGAKLDALELGSVERSRVLTVDALEAFIRDRHTFVVASALTEDQQNLTAGILSALDRSRDPVVVEKHVKNARGSGRQRQRSDVAVVEKTMTATSPPASKAVKPAAGRGRRRSKSNPLTDLLAAAAMIALLWWFVYGGGFLWGARLADALVFKPMANAVTDSAAPTTAPARSVSAVDVARAKDKLREADPAKFEALVDASAPQVAKGQGYTTYTWEYLEQTDQRTVRSRFISLTVDDAWVVRGVDIK